MFILSISSTKFRPSEQFLPRLPPIQFRSSPSSVQFKVKFSSSTRLLKLHNPPPPSTCHLFSCLSAARYTWTANHLSLSLCEQRMNLKYTFLCKCFLSRYERKTQSRQDSSSIFLASKIFKTLLSSSHF